MKLYKRKQLKPQRRWRPLVRDDQWGCNFWAENFPSEIRPQLTMLETGFTITFELFYNKAVLSKAMARIESARVISTLRSTHGRRSPWRRIEGYHSQSSAWR